MPIKIGNTGQSNISLGDNVISKVYVGSKLVFQKDIPEVIYMTTEAITVTIKIGSVTGVIYDWGDGNFETILSDVSASHTYTDGVMTHDIVATADAVRTIVCNNNSLMSLDVSSNTVLTYLACNNNILTSLNISSNTTLRSLFCQSNSLDSNTINAHLKSLVHTSISGGFYLAMAQSLTATPTGAGVQDKATLIANGWTVITD